MGASTSSRPVEMVTAETKIFSVAVQPGKSDASSGSRNYQLRNVEGQMIDRPVILNTKLSVQELDSDDEFKPTQREVEEFIEDCNIAEKVEVVEEVKLDKETSSITTETKKSKKKKKNKNTESAPY